MNGAPANPMSGLPPSSPTRDLTASARNGTSAGSSGRSRSTSPSVRNGRSTTGPTPGLMSTSTPIARSGTTMSLNRTAASTS